MQLTFRLALAMASAWLAMATPSLGQAAQSALAPGKAVVALADGAPKLPTDSAAPAAGDQIKTLEQQVEVVLTEARRQQTQIAQMRERLGAAEATNTWLPWLVLALVLCGVLVVWLALRLMRLQRQLSRRPAPQAEAPGAAQTSGLGAMVMPTAQAADRPFLSPTGAMSGVAGATQPAFAQPRLSGVSQPEPTRPVAEFSLGTGVPPRPVSVEELLDLDQQVDFFLALGQEQSAVDLLLSHVRGTGGTSALPYFKLLEIYHQQGDEEAYERTRERFNQRFNAFAPEWAGDLAGGRALEAYPEVMQRLQRAWPQPMRAVAELESLLLRRADLEPFDLPAYRDVLLLHALVRDLPAAPVLGAATTPAVLARDEPPPPLSLPATPPPPPAPTPATSWPQMRPADAVDLLLPLGEEAADITSPRPHVSERNSAQALLAEWVFTRAASPRSAANTEGQGLMERASGPSSRPMRLDLDLSDYAPAPREFTRPAAFTDIDMRRDRRLSDLGGLDSIDSESPPMPSRR